MLNIEIDHDIGIHAVLTYDAVASAGLPSRPLEFPNPTVHKGARLTVGALDHRTGRIYNVKNVLMRTKSSSKGNLHNNQNNGPTNRAYVIKKKVSKSIYGVIRLCVVLRRRAIIHPQQQLRRRRRDDGLPRDEDVEWESTEELCVVKVSSWARMRQLRGRHLEDPIKEISAMQLIGNYHPNVLGCIEVLQDDEYLYTIMPYCAGGDLFGRVMGNDKTRTDSQLSDKTFDQAGTQVEEGKARLWFRQLLSGLFHLQRKGVCHRDISLENLMIDDENDELKIIDMGMCLRVPYVDLDNEASDRVTDVSDGTERLLMKSQGQGGKLMYMAPEVVAREDVFDGFAIDLWAAGVVLFVMLVGLAPFKWAHPSDKRYAKIAKGNLKELMSGLHLDLSDEACDLLQNMFWWDPRKRLTLAQILQHPWVQNKKFAMPATVPPPKTKPVHSQAIWKRAMAHP
eukprot:CAMPEP_0116542362 /NCGR_PEP_ID=MMETSP0397-20121206/978_1 /TAXON_ID=216820 /ORGANISM="Cyclophora tenuis, Strain ECT3854" /LENGTH=452 /DNA_ID=CAMNT_0004066371 /DNA_START=1 /DNA_END=1359 /DNA_ORIENTATION=+